MVKKCFSVFCGDSEVQNTPKFHKRQQQKTKYNISHNTPTVVSF